MNTNINTSSKNVGVALRRNSIENQKKAYITSRELFIDRPRQRECFITDNSPKLLSANLSQISVFKSTFNFVSDGLSPLSTFRTGVELGDTMLKLENKSIYSGRFLGKAFKAISYAPTHHKFTKIALKLASSISPDVYRPVKGVVDIARKSSLIKWGSRIGKRVPFLGLGIASYNIYKSYSKYGNSFDFWSDASFEVIDALSPVPFTKEIIEGSADYEARKAKDFLENRDRYLFMPMHAGKI